jgi:hypothetical protein
MISKGMSTTITEVQPNIDVAVEDSPPKQPLTYLMKKLTMIEEKIQNLQKELKDIHSDKNLDFVEASTKLQQQATQRYQIVFEISAHNCKTVLTADVECKTLPNGGTTKYLK